jgi:hypothetical protein
MQAIGTGLAVYALAALGFWLAACWAFGREVPIHRFAHEGARAKR